MATLLVKNARIVVTFDSADREIPNAGLFIRDGFIEEVGPTQDLPQTADRVIDLHGHVVLPGMVNTHHHFYQTLTRVVPAAQDCNLFTWLKTLYPIWGRMTPDDIYISTKTALAELALSGCTTASDHLYLFPNGCRLDDEIAAAKEIGLRLHASRGSMSLGESQGGLPPDHVVDSEEHILKDSVRLIERYHDPEAGSMLQIVLAPCSPFSVTSELMRNSAALARQYGVHLHTHLAETKDEEAFCIQRFGLRPAAYMQSVDWIGNDVWFAHSVYINAEEINLYAQHGCGVAHCPSSNMRLASGIAPVAEYLAAGVKLGLGVDGSASNDSSNMISEARVGMLLGRVRAGLEGASLSGSDSPSILNARTYLKMATKGGAAVLGRSDIGSLEVGKCADFIAINMETLDYAGALHDPVSALLFCHTNRVDWNIVHGNIIVENGRLMTDDLDSIVKQHNKAARRLLSE
jgi:cytosine/adenosine deaminase-related metal-dependent hydrolase